MGESNFQNNERVSLGSNMSITVDDNASTMTISLRPGYALEVLEIVALVIFLLSLANAYEVICMAFMAFFLIGVLYGVYQKRVLRCVIKKSSGTVQYFRGGVLGSPYDKKEINFPISNIADFEMRRFRTWGRPDQFQIWAILNHGERIDLSGKMLLNYSDCRAKAEMFKNFANPKLSILEFDNP